MVFYFGYMFLKDITVVVYDPVFKLVYGLRILDNFLNYVLINIFYLTVLQLDNFWNIIILDKLKTVLNETNNQG